VSVFISDFKPGDGSWTVTHDDAPGGAHSGSIQPTDVSFAPAIAGGTEWRTVLITCPVCGAVSAHPVGGGAVPPSVQEMFVRAGRRLGCPCGSLPANRPFGLVISHMKTHVQQTDGPSRWQAIANIN